MLKFTCPVCGGFLFKRDSSYKCGKGHSYDIARQGYINLLQSQQSGLKRHGDDKMMIRARFDFLNKGYYKPLLEKICYSCRKYLKDGSCIVDAGCGDCYYSSGLLDDCIDKGFKIFGVDISKDALICASRRGKEISLAVGSAYSLPFHSGSADAVLNIFSPLAGDEYKRIIKQGGFLFRAVPLEEHLYGLKQRIYETPYKNEAVTTSLDGFELCENIEIKYELEIDNRSDIENLFKMTPYYYKTSSTDQKKLESIDSLLTQIEFSLLIYKRV